MHRNYISQKLTSATIAAHHRSSLNPQPTFERAFASQCFQDVIPYPGAMVAVLLVSRAKESHHRILRR